jgi:tetratricopeptide (TPR) repeat protein
MSEPDVAALQAERDFLLRSLDDLEVERAEGNLDEDRYRELHDDYTARAAAVIRALKDGAGRDLPAPPTGRRRRLVVTAAIAGFALTAAGVMALAVNDRGEGDSATGNQQTSESTGGLSDEEAAKQAAAAAEQLKALQQKVTDNPSDAVAHRQLAQALLTSGNIADAVKEFDTAAQLDPADAESLAYGGWVVFLAARGAQPEAVAELIDGAVRRLDAAVAANGDYPDARFFRGMVLLRGKNDPAAAAPEFERYLALVPDGPQSEPVRRLLEQAKAGTTSTTGGNPGG